MFVHMRKEPRDFIMADIEKDKVENSQRERAKLGHKFVSRYSKEAPTSTNDSAVELSL